MKKTLVLGASPKPQRYSNKAVQLLVTHGYNTVAVAARESKIGDTNIVLAQSVSDTDIHTISIYLRAERQAQYYDYLLALQPQRIIFNPGTENAELAKLAREQNIEVVEACTLVMLGAGTY